MILDKEEHRSILIQLVSKNAFPGEFAEQVVELKEALKSASVGKEDVIISDVDKT